MGDASRPSPAAARWVLWLAASISVVAALSPRDLWSPDEPRYGRIADEMERGGSWLVSHWNGDFDAEKPPVGYWIMAIGGRLGGGVGPVASRLPCALLAALAVVATARLGRRWFRDAALGDTAALLFATTGLVLWNSSRAGLDLPMTAFVLLATWAGTSLVERPSLPAALGCGASIGLGLLVKGPHALYVPIAALVGGCIASGAARRLRDPRWVLASLAMVAVVAAWLWPALTFGEAGYRERLLGQLTSRVRGEGEPHVHAFPYMVPMLLACGLPWTPAWLAAVEAWKRRTPQDRFGLGAAVWGTLVPLLLLSLPATKRDVYLVPLLPCLALLAAYGLHRAPQGHAARATTWAGVACAAGLGLGALLAPVLGARAWPGGPYDPVNGSTLGQGRLPAALVGLGLLGLAGAAVAFRRRHDAVASIRASAAALAAVWMVAAIAVLPAFDDAKTWEAAVVPVRGAEPGAPMVACGFTDAALPWAFRPDVIPRVAPDPKDVPAVLASLFAEGAPRTVVALETRAWKQAVSADPSLASRASPLWERRVGPRVFTILVPKAPRR